MRGILSVKNVNMTKAGNLCVFVCVCDCNCDMLMLVLGTCWTTFVFMSIVYAQKWIFVIMSHITFCMSHVICQMLMLIPGTCWTNFIFMSMLKADRAITILCLPFTMRPSNDSILDVQIRQDRNTSYNSFQREKLSTLGIWVD